MWERLGLADEVALYVRRLAEGEVAGASTALGTLLRQQQEALGLSLPGLARNRWVIEDSPAPTKVTKADDPDRSAKSRFKAIAGGVAS